MADQLDLVAERWRAAWPDPVVSPVAVVHPYQPVARLAHGSDGHVVAALSAAERTLRRVPRPFGERT